MQRLAFAEAVTVRFCNGVSGRAGFWRKQSHGIIALPLSTLETSAMTVLLIILEQWEPISPFNAELKNYGPEHET